jgi:hypothetical protein
MTGLEIFVVSVVGDVLGKVASMGLAGALGMYGPSDDKPAK